MHTHLFMQKQGPLKFFESAGAGVHLLFWAGSCFVCLFVFNGKKDDHFGHLDVQLLNPS